MLPKLIQFHHLPPILSHFHQPLTLRQIYQRQQILLKATAPKPHRSLQELTAYSRVTPYTLFDFQHIAARLLTQ